MNDPLSFQAGVVEWMLECFGQEISADKRERSHRFIEEALELVQATGIPREEVLMLVDYVYGRTTGETKQEIGGVMVTLAALCGAHGISMMSCGHEELARVWTKIEQIRAKQAGKPRNSPLPQLSHLYERMLDGEDLLPPLVRRQMDER